MVCLSSGALVALGLQTMTCFTDLDDLQKPFIFSTLICASFKNEQETYINSRKLVD